MNAAYASTVGEFRQSITAGHLDVLIQKIECGFFEVYKQLASAEERKAWIISLPALISRLPNGCDGLQILIELRMPIGNERADVILLGGSSSHPRAVVVELKHWNGNIEPYPSSPNLVVLGSERGLIRQHPAYQTDGYVGKLRNYHSVGQDFEVEGLVYLHDVGATNALRQLMSGYKSYVAFKDDTNEVVRRVVQLLPSELTASDAKQFASGEYVVSGRLVDFVNKNKEAIKSKIYTELAATGFGLCEEQALAVGEILHAANRAVQARQAGEKCTQIVFIVNGPPGSGKTLVALTALVDSLGSGVRALYGLRRNGALVNTLRRALRGDLDGSIQFLNVPRTDSGILDNGFHGEHLDLLICDEAQRMLLNSLPVALARASVVVFLVDETQRLNMDEQGISQNFENAAKQAGATVMSLPSLPAGIRCRGGISYHNFVEQLLLKPKEIQFGALQRPPWGRSYRFEVFGDYVSFHSAIEKLRDEQKLRVALVASWTESDGDMAWRLNMRPNTNAKNIRVGSRLQSGRALYPQETNEVSWVMNPDDYRTFWAGESSRLDICASIYGSQGFESDAVGFIWGNDLVWNQQRSQWELGAPNTSYDYSGGTQRQQSIKTLVNQIGQNLSAPNYEQVKTLLLNRARIFLTRGILATLVYAEDEGTRNFLRALFNG